MEKLETRAWQAKWICDAGYKSPRKASPVPTVFRRRLELRGAVKSATLYATALGIYEFAVDGQKVGDQWFAPGFTSYRHQLQYQAYDVGSLLRDGAELTATVAGGWAVGSFNFQRKAHIAAPRCALLAELVVEYADGTTETVGTDEGWSVSEGGPVRMAEFYDGETYDAGSDLGDASWRSASVTRPAGEPALYAQYGPAVRTQRRLEPVSCAKAPSGEWVYDFGQNFAGVVHARITGAAGQKVVFRHAELLQGGELYVANLRTAKATATYLCRDGSQEYTPRFTYMGFRYVGVSGIEPSELELSALVLGSSVEKTGGFRCSDERLNRLQENIEWGARSNFVDIPTDCPQRDERMGWTGDIALFASTACFNFDLSRFFEKWLLDLVTEQQDDGALPLVVPQNGYGSCTTTACWGDACVLVPWAEYLARGDVDLLRRCYPAMKRFLGSVRKWAGRFATGTKRHIWKLPFQYGDWAAPKGSFRDWKRRGPWVATAFYANSCGIAAQVAELLGETDDAAAFRETRAEVCCAYSSVFTDGRGRLKDEFQTGYVLPLYFGMVEGEERAAMAANLDRLVEQDGDHLATGFPGTPYLLFALSDNGYAERAYKVLLQDTCPSWLYEVGMGATTVWERWDGIRPDGTPNPGGMVSFNHYASGAVGDWLYRRVLGIEPLRGGYMKFKVAPVPGGGLSWAEGGTKTPCGEIRVHWDITEGVFSLQVDVPVGTTCEATVPGGKTAVLQGGRHRLSDPLPPNWPRLEERA